MTAASDLLRVEHRAIERELDELESALKHLDAGRVATVRRCFEQIQSLSTVHFRHEEDVFYPGLRQDAPELLAQMDEQHEYAREMEEMLRSLLASFPASPTERDLAELYTIGLHFHDAVQCHIIEEEQHLLTWADAHLTPQKQARLREEMRAL